jgi:hypothetical protein
LYYSREIKYRKTNKKLEKGRKQIKRGKMGNTKVNRGKCHIEKRSIT